MKPEKYYIRYNVLFFSAPPERRIYLGENGRPEGFETLADARKKIDQLNAQVWYQPDGSYSRPTYAAVKGNRLPQALLNYF